MSCGSRALLNNLLHPASAMKAGRYSKGPPVRRQSSFRLQPSSDSGRCPCNWCSSVWSLLQTCPPLPTLAPPSKMCNLLRHHLLRHHLALLNYRGIAVHGYLLSTKTVPKKLGQAPAPPDDSCDWRLRALLNPKQHQNVRTLEYRRTLANTQCICPYLFQVRHLLSAKDR